jgi:hypothetical protein
MQFQKSKSNIYNQWKGTFQVDPDVIRVENLELTDYKEVSMIVGR